MTRALPVAFRLATVADVNAIREIEKLSYPVPWPRLQFMDELKNPFSYTLLAGPPPPAPWELWGYIIYWLVADEMHILNLAVHPAQRRRGIGRSLVQEAMTRARRVGIQGVWLEVRPSNKAAQALYYSFGFKHIGTRQRYYNDTGEDALIMALTWDT